MSWSPWSSNCTCRPSGVDPICKHHNPCAHATAEREREQ
jgi:hypothetical protein